MLGRHLQSMFFRKKLRKSKLKAKVPTTMPGEECTPRKKDKTSEQQ